MIIGKYVKQKEGYKAFIPEKFPPKNLDYLDINTIELLSLANLYIGKLDGITKLLPDIDFFIFMYINKEATYSSQIEGTKANLTDALQAEIEKIPGLPDDVDDILHYIEAMNSGLSKLDKLPLSLRLIKDVHKIILTNGRTTNFAYPGEFRRSQNWIRGTNINDAKFIPPPYEFLSSAMGDIEKFFYSHKEIPTLIKAALIHSQFEIIHPFLDGNGRTGRLLITLFLCQQKFLGKPVLYLSEYFKKHRNKYFDLLEDYSKGNVNTWINFFLKGIIDVSKEAISTSDKIIDLREKDIQKISSLGRSSGNSMLLLKQLYKTPIVNVKRIEESLNISREASNKLADRFCKMGLLSKKDKNIKYGRIFVYKKYLDLFNT